MYSFILLIEASFPDKLAGWSSAEVANNCLGDYLILKMCPGESVRDTVRRVMTAGELPNQREVPLYMMRRIGTVRKDEQSPTGRFLDPK